ncbi:hypothetical protein NDU88_005273 [Pleurodeles waltl]|uniref:Uncharacterized protein n=1 Tax=Pleurodeles waltl TaxID=8319 RepID=A0AAV7UHK0_PLEWA|nr:hypothetical protein NDU88_005273 [Pleurodeles waltl]
MGDANHGECTRYIKEGLSTLRFFCYSTAEVNPCCNTDHETTQEDGFHGAEERGDAKDGSAVATKEKLPQIEDGALERRKTDW